MTMPTFTNTTPTKLRADFNGLDDGRIRVSLRLQPQVSLAIGDWVELSDADGSWCMATVESIERSTLTCLLALDTWRTVTSHTFGMLRPSHPATGVDPATGSTHSPDVAQLDAIAR